MTFHLLRAEDRARTGHPQLGRLTLYQMSYFRLIILLILKNYYYFLIDDSGFQSVIFYSISFTIFTLSIANSTSAIPFCGERRIRTFEVETTDLQSVPFGHSGISPKQFQQKKEPMEGFEPPTS